MVENYSSLLVGVLFGASLDLAGFGSAKKLNDQFLLRDFSMFKVMFGAIVFSASFYYLFLQFGFSPVGSAVLPTLNLGLLLGGCLLGMGLVVGGYCPGTAVAGAAGGRIDAILFLITMYPGYQLWIWLEPKLSVNFRSPLTTDHVTLPDWLGASVISILIALGLLCWLGWKAGDYFEKQQREKKF